MPKNILDLGSETAREIGAADDGEQRGEAVNGGLLREEAQDPRGAALDLGGDLLADILVSARSGFVSFFRVIGLPEVAECGRFFSEKAQAQIMQERAWRMKIADAVTALCFPGRGFVAVLKDPRKDPQCTEFVILNRNGAYTGYCIEILPDPPFRIRLQELRLEGSGKRRQWRRKILTDCTFEEMIAAFREKQQSKGEKAPVALQHKESAGEPLGRPAHTVGIGEWFEPPAHAAAGPLGEPAHAAAAAGGGDPEQAEDELRTALRDVMSAPQAASHDASCGSQELQTAPKRNAADEKPQLVADGPISEEEAATVLILTEIHGDAFDGKKLTVSRLHALGLSPKVKVVFEDGIIYLSAPYNLGNGRIACVAYVHKEGKIVARSVYRSNSHVLWKLLPDYMEAYGTVGHFGKGKGEASIVLPFEAQKSLSMLSSQEPLTVDDPDFVFAGAAARPAGPSGMNITYVLKTRKKSHNHGRDLNLFKFVPEKIRPDDPADEPDFSATIDEFDMESDLYRGKVRMEIFRSVNGKLKWAFCRDSRDRVWIAGAELTDASLTSVGVYEDWFNLGNLSTPAYDYWEETQRDHRNPDDRNGQYVDTFKNFLSKIPLIAKYCESRGIPLPA